jgi:hypothetical protein
MWQPAGRNGNPALHLRRDGRTAPAQQRAEATVVAELLAVLPDEVEHRADALAFALPQAAAELLEEEQRAVGGPEHEERVHGRHVDALVEQVDREHHVQPPGGQVAQGLLPLISRVSAQTAVDGMPASLNTRAM